MSVYASVNDTVARRKAQQEIPSAVVLPPAAVAVEAPVPGAASDGGVAVAAPPATTATQAEAESVPASALGVITKHIPTEVIGAYLAVIAIVPAGRSHVPHWMAFWFFLLMTPVVVWLGVALKQGVVDFAPATWPLWPMLAATLAFVAWAAVIPNSVMSYLAWFEPYMGALAIVLLAFLLPVGEAFSQLKPKPAASSSSSRAR